MNDDDGENDKPLGVAAIAELGGDHVQKVPLPSWPVFALADMDSPGWLCGIGQSHHGLHTIRIDYRPPFADERLIVQTETDDAVSDLIHVLSQLQADSDEGEPLGTRAAPEAPIDPRSSDQPITVGHDAVNARTLQTDRAWVCCTRLHGVSVLIGARSLPLQDIRLVQIDDLAPFKAARSAVIANL